MNDRAWFRKAQSSSPQTHADQLRNVLEQLETHVGKLEHGGDSDPLALPLLLDEAQDLLTALQEKGGNWKPEETRLETVTAQLRRKAKTFVRQAGGATALKEARAAHAPPNPAWWWRLDEIIREERRQRLRKLGKWAAIIAAVFLVLGLAYKQFLAPSPELMAALERQREAEELAAQGDFVAALDKVEAGLTNAPDHVELLTLKGILMEALGREAEATAAFERARTLTEDENLFLRLRAQLYLRTRLLDGAQKDAQTLIERDPEAPSGYLFLGMVYDARGEWQQAVTHYEKASELAAARDEAQIYVTARTLLAQLLQHPPLDMLTPTPE
ncbi:MAG: tetratricopeptide repeat protein [Anaerolineae bacterium]